MSERGILSDRDIIKLSEYLPYPEGSGEEVTDFETLSGIVEQAVAPYLKTISDPAQVMVFVFRAFYFLGALHGMQTYRYEIGGAKYFPELEETKFSLDRYSAIDFCEFMQSEVPPELIDGICQKFGFEFEEGETDDE